MTHKSQGMMDLLVLISKYNRWVIINTLVVCLLTAGLSFIVPKTFRANSTVLPPQEDSNLSLSSFLSNHLPFTGMGFDFLNASGETNLYIAILNSRTVMEATVRHFDLVRLYRVRHIEEAVRILRKNCQFRVNDDGTIEIRTDAATGWFSGADGDDRARTRAMDMANFIVRNLDSLNTALKKERASLFRKFIEERYHLNIEELTRAEDALNEFQKMYGAVDLSEQTKATITAAAELKAQIIAKEVELAVLRNYVGRGHVDEIRVENEVRELEKRYSDFISGKRLGRDISDPFIPLTEVPDLGIRYLRIFRDVALQEKILEILLPMYEQAKIEEAKNTPTVQILDPAVIPFKKAKPRRLLLVVFAAALSLFAGISGAVITDRYLQGRKNRSEGYRKWETACRFLKKNRSFD